MIKFLAIDPGEKTGWAVWAEDKRQMSGVLDLAVLKATKKRSAEAKHLRLVKLYNWMQKLRNEVGGPKLVIVEEAAGFTKGKSAVVAAAKYRAIIELFCGLNDIEITYIQPTDLKRYVCAKGDATKDEVILSARRRWGFNGTSDDECDAFCLMQWAVQHLP
jgi:Holliday junction resolvasome RuvABC endonuclease subunit